jgi:hypothetical protein
MRRIRVVRRRRRTRLDRLALDLRTPSGRRELPY